ncbi:MAG: hypothetical protein ABJB66_18445 [Gemmatimonadaceae bacterium]
MTSKVVRRGSARACTLAIVLLSVLACSAGRDTGRDTGANAPAAETAATPAPAVVNNNANAWVISEYGLGPLRAGMTFQAASDSLKGALRAEKGVDLSGCNYVQWINGPRGALVMVVDGKIARVDVTTTDISTEAGARVGDTESHVQNLYPGRVQVTPHKYEDGHYLTIKSANIRDSLYRIIFETSSGRVTRYRAGLSPAVEYVEGCS